MNMLFRTLMTGILVCVSSGNVSAAQCLIGPHIVGLTQVRTDDGLKAKVIMLDVLVVDVAVGAYSEILPADLARIATGLAAFSSSRIPQLPDKFELTNKDHLPSVLLNKHCVTETRRIEIIRNMAITSYEYDKDLWTRNMSGDWRQFMPATAAAKSLAAADLVCGSYSWCSAFLAKGVAAAGADQDKPARVIGPVLTRVEPKQPSAEDIAALKKAQAVELKRKADEAADVKAKAAAGKAKAQEREEVARASCMKPGGRGMCACMRFYPEDKGKGNACGK